MGLMIFAVLGNALSVWIESPQILTNGYLERFLLATFVLFFIAAGNFKTYLDETSGDIPKISEESIKPHRYVFTSISPYQEWIDKKTGETKSNMEPLFVLLATHQSRLHKLYLVGTYDHEVKGEKGVELAYNRLVQHIQVNYPQYIPEKMLKKLSINNANTAEEAFAVIWKELGNLPGYDTLVDITAGTKALTVGSTLAALERGCHVSYSATPRGADGLPLVGSRAIPSILTSDLIVQATRYSRVVEEG